MRSKKSDASLVVKDRSVPTCYISIDLLLQCFSIVIAKMTADARATARDHGISARSHVLQASSGFRQRHSSDEKVCHGWNRSSRDAISEKSAEPFRHL
jgi:hypothetical protein